LSYKIQVKVRCGDLEEYKQMRSMHPVSTMVLVGMWLGGFSACSPALLMNTPVSKSADGWGITLGEVKEGPDEYIGEGGIRVTSDAGEKLIWTLVTVRNDSGEEETFSYDTCALEGKGGVRPPEVVDRHAEVNAAADRSEAIAPGQSRTRQLIFAYPSDHRPDRMKCGKIVLPIKGPR
jgi:hypothetical protein